MAQTGAQKIEPISAAPLLAVLAQMESMVGSPAFALTPANILKLLVHLKNMLRCIGGVAGSYNALLEECWSLQEKNEKLERHLARYENAHSPPRAQRDAGETRQTENDEGGPKMSQGGQPGHRGATTVPEPDFECTAEFLEACDCGECRVTNIRNGKEQVFVDFKIIKKVTRYRNRYATCVKCGKERKGKFYHIKPIDRSPVPPPAEADPPGRDIVMPESGLPPYRPPADAAQAPPQPHMGAPDSPPPAPAGEREPHPETVQKTSVPQAPSGSDTRREIKVPKFGRFGMSVILAVLLFWDGRSVIRRIGFQMEHVAGVVIGTGTTFNMLARIAACLAPEMSKILWDLLQSPYLHIDETTVWIGGRRMYVWIIATRTAVLYFPFSRHGAMLLAMLATYTGIVISDGYKVYKRFKRRQRCWAHLLREARDLKKKIDTRYADNFYLGLKNILKTAKEKKAAGVGPEWHDAMNAELERLLSYYSRYEDLLPVINTIRNDPGVWFTFMLYSYVDPTNNWAEQMVREVVKQRIMRQTLRTVEGAMIFTTLLSCMGTWRLSGRDIRGQLEKYVAA